VEPVLEELLLIVLVVKEIFMNITALVSLPVQMVIIMLLALLLVMDVKLVVVLVNLHVYTVLVTLLKIVLNVKLQNGYKLSLDNKEKPNVLILVKMVNMN
jgi:hypothetical protein